MILFPWSKIVVCKNTAITYINSFPKLSEPRYYNGYFFREIERVHFLFFDIPLLWKETGNIWIPPNESEFEVCCLKDYIELRKKILPCKACLWFRPFPFKEYGGFCEVAEDLNPVDENHTCSKWSNQ